MVAADLLPHLRAAKDLMDREYAEPLQLDILARRARCSRYHFLRAFAAAYGQTPGRYLTHRRIERAQELLRWANLSVTEVCMLVGFTSLGSFSARFREVVGESPTAYRRRVVGSGGPPPVPGCFVLMWSNPLPAKVCPPNRGDLPAGEGRSHRFGGQTPGRQRAIGEKPPQGGRPRVGGQGQPMLRRETR